MTAFEDPQTMKTPAIRAAKRLQRIRTLALSAGVVLGMAAATFGPQLAHAATSKANKKTIAEKIVQLPEATAEQLLAAERVLVGRYECEFGKSVSVDPDVKSKGYFNLKLGKQSWTMKPVLSSTGAIRLEDIKGAALMIQILTKSMLMDPKAGHRLVDGCMHDTQRAADEELKLHPRASVFNLGSDAPAEAKK
jgi:hypothetical protein